MPSPIIIKHPMDQTIPINETAMFVCVGQGYGFVSVSWLIGRGNNERFPPDKATVTTMVTLHNITTILIIPDITDEDGKNFRCKYDNMGGESKSNIAKLILESKC